MTTSKVDSVGVIVLMNTNGWYTVEAWFRLAGGGRHQSTVFENLSWTEACDVMLAWTDHHRPGWQVGDGWRQPDLFSEGSG